jgi:hypothetical protein
MKLRHDRALPRSKLLKTDKTLHEVEHPLMDTAWPVLPARLTDTDDPMLALTNTEILDVSNAVPNRLNLLLTHALARSDNELPHTHP